MTNEIQRFTALLQTSEMLIEQATKQDVAEVARVLSLHVAHCGARHGNVSIEESLKDAAQRKNRRRAGKPACFTKDSLLRGNVAKQVGRSAAGQ